MSIFEIFFKKKESTNQKTLETTIILASLSNLMLKVTHMTHFVNISFLFCKKNSRRQKFS